jgi:hypothetical protein
MAKKQVDNFPPNVQFSCQNVPFRPLSSSNVVRATRKEAITEAAAFLL